MTAENLKLIIKSTPADSSVKEMYLSRAAAGSITREENQEDHICTYFAAYDPQARQVFIGHHIKSGLWLFNGGHMDPGELPLDTLLREISEEWGSHIDLPSVNFPSLLTVTNIVSNPSKQACKIHYDIWYFLPFNKEDFSPDPKLLAAEFHQTGWETINEAKILVKDPNTLQALSEIEKLFE